MMTTRAAHAKRPASLPAALLTAGIVFTAACSAPGNEVIFEGAAPEAAVPAPASSAALTGPEPQPASTEPPGAAPSGADASEAAPAAAQTQVTEAAEPGPAAAQPPAPPPLDISPRDLDLESMQMAVNGPSGRSVTVFGPNTEQVELYAAEGEFVSQPTWSPDGRSVAWARISAEGASVVIGRAEGGPSASYETPFGVYYMQWRPDGRALGMLGSPDPGRVALAILDLDRGAVIPMNSSTSYYFHWSPAGNELITRLGRASLALLDPDTGDASPLEAAVPANSDFQAAAWTNEGRSILYVRPAGGSSGGPEPEERRDELVIHDLDTGEVEVLGEGAGYFNFSLSPDGASVAYSIQNLGTATAMRVVDLATGGAEEIDAPGAFAWQWSPDSRKILLLGVGPNALTVSVYESGGITRYQDIVPTDTFLRSYLLFWGQYDLSHDLWAPDSSGFVYAAFDRNDDYVFFQPLDEENPILVGPGSMAAFAPASPAPQ